MFDNLVFLACIMWEEFQEFEGEGKEELWCACVRDERPSNFNSTSFPGEKPGLQ